jgi:hypothetical protein
MERSGMRGCAEMVAPDFVALNPGYARWAPLLAVSACRRDRVGANIKEMFLPRASLARPDFLILTKRKKLFDRSGGRRAASGRPRAASSLVQLASCEHWSLFQQEGLMHSMRLVSVVLVAAAAMGLQASAARADGATAWSTNAAACVPVSASGYSVTAGAVTAGAGVTVTLYCGITRAALTGGFANIQITHKGGAGVVTGGVGTTGARAVIPARGLVTAELIEMSKATGDENVRCGVQPKGSTTIKTESNLCSNSSQIDFNNNFYYVRIVLRSGIVAGQLETVYGSALTGR